MNDKQTANQPQFAKGLKGIIANETGAKIYTLDMAMASGSYFDAMHHNIQIIKEALE